MKVLLVDSDNAALGRYADYFSGQRVYDCSVVESGEEALEAHRRFHFDVALINLLTNGTLSGIETAERLIQIHALELVFYAQSFDPGIAQAALLLQPALILSKPVDGDRLHDALEFIRQRRMRRSSAGRSLRRSPSSR